MRRRKVIFVVLMALALAGAAGEAAPSQEPGSLTVRDRSGAAVGRIDAHGVFRDRSGASFGRFDEGAVRDRSGSLLGRIDADGTIRDRSGASMGRVEANGTLRDRSGSLVGRIHEDGTVRNRAGSASGRFDGYLPAHCQVVAAYLFFFDPLHRR